MPRRFRRKFVVSLLLRRHASRMQGWRYDASRTRRRGGNDRSISFAALAARNRPAEKPPQGVIAEMHGLRWRLFHKCSQPSKAAG
jgi:hypothetical protein